MNIRKLILWAMFIAVFVILLPAVVALSDALVALFEWVGKNPEVLIH